jgi:MFS family permease
MRSKPMILAALLLAAFLINLDTTLVNVALPAMVRELHATTTQLQWVVDAYNLVSCLVAAGVAAAGALLAVLFLPAQPARPAAPAADQAETAGGTHETGPQARTVPAAR